jgi:hypothetical protein
LMLFTAVTSPSLSRRSVVLNHRLTILWRKTFSSALVVIFAGRIVIAVIPLLISIRVIALLVASFVWWVRILMLEVAILIAVALVRVLLLINRLVIRPITFPVFSKVVVTRAKTSGRIAVCFLKRWKHVVFRVLKSRIWRIILQFKSIKAMLMQICTYLFNKNLATVKLTLTHLFNSAFHVSP